MRFVYVCAEVFVVGVCSGGGAEVLFLFFVLGRGFVGGRGKKVRTYASWERRTTLCMCCL